MRAEAPPSRNESTPRPPVTPADVERLFREHGPFVWRALRRLGLSETDADDACQEVFVVVYQRLASFEERSSLRTWLYGICVRRAAAHRRRASTLHEVPTSTPPDGVDIVGPHERFVAGEARQLLDRALDRLDEDKRAVFVLYEFEDLSMPEVAEAVSCPLQTAYSRLYAARQAVEDNLARMTKGRWRE